MQGKSQLEARSAQQQVYVGIDACKEHLDAYLHPGGQRLRVANHRDGIGRVDGTIVWVYGQAEAVLGVDGQVDGFIGSVTRLTS